MTPGLALAVALGAAVGAPLRFLVERWFLRVAGDRWPWGTVVVNLVGSLVLGVVAGLAVRGGASAEVVALVGTGFCGALTTFSGFSAQVLELSRGGSARGLIYAGGSLVLGVALAAIGFGLASG